MNIFGGVLILLKFLNRHIIKTFLPILLCFPFKIYTLYVIKIKPLSRLNSLNKKTDTLKFTLILSPFKCHNCQAISHTLKLAL